MDRKLDIYVLHELSILYKVSITIIHLSLAGRTPDLVFYVLELVLLDDEDDESQVKLEGHLLKYKLS
jgi:hypothetical protein